MIAWRVLLIFSATAAIAQADGMISEPRQAELRYLLAQDCGSCHGLTRRGGLGPALTAEALRGRAPSALAWTIYNGRPGTAMPAWSPFLTAAEVDWLVQELLTGTAGSTP